MKNVSTSQMDDFYSALSIGRPKTSGVMNYIQHLYVADRCRPGARVLEFCCGRGLLIPLLQNRAPRIQTYVGVDIAQESLSEARDRLGAFSSPPFDTHFIRADIGRVPLEAPFDVIVYTSSIEHMNRDEGLQSLHEARRLLAPDGRLFLSSPATPATSPRTLQYKVHVYEWDQRELRDALDEAGFRVDAHIGLLPPADDPLEAELRRDFGDGGVRLYQALRERVPTEFLAPVIAAALPQVAREVLFSCARAA